MKTDCNDQKRQKVRNLLLLLAESQEVLSTARKKSDIYIELESIYHDSDSNGNFRHFYSDLFAVITQIDSDMSKGNTEILTQNMELIRSGYQASNKDGNGKHIDICKEINKLYDHINLEISRLNYTKHIERRTQSDLQRVNSALGDVESKVLQIEDNIEKADAMEKQYITILGIFAAIVLAFTGGIAFSTSVLENIDSISIYRLCIVLVGLAFVLTNTIYILTRFIQEINKRSAEKVYYPKYMMVLNILFGICVLSIIVCWLFDVIKAAELFRKIIYK